MSSKYSIKKEHTFLENTAFNSQNINMDKAEIKKHNEVDLRIK